MANPTSEALNKPESIGYDTKSKSLSSSDSSLDKFPRDATRKLGSMASEFSDRTSEYVRTGREYVKEHPTTGVAIAAAAGLVAGSLLTMVFRRRH